MTTGIFIWLIGVPLMKDGMFVDGVQYAAVSRNLSLGIGTYWEPHYSASLFAHFHQQPPGFIWLQSLFFTFGADTIYPERLFCFVEGVVMMLLIAYAWKYLNTDPGVSQLTWLPQLIWLSVPTVSWGLRNNVVENAMVIADWVSVLLIIQAFEKKGAIFYFLLAVFFLFCASFIKGIQGLFPLATPALYWLATRKITFKKMTLVSCVMLILIGACYFLLLSYQPAFESYRQYFESRLSGFPHTLMQTTNNRLWLLFEMSVELLIPIILFVVAILFYRISTNPIENQNWLQQKRNSLFFLLTGLSSSLPLLISFEQRTFYTITAIPFFATATSLFIAPALNIFIEKINWNDKGKFLQHTKILMWVLIMAGIIMGYLNAGKIGRDQELITDVRTIMQYTGSAREIVVSPGLKSQWILHGYFQRYGNISLLSDCDYCSYYMQLKSEYNKSLPGYKLINLPASGLELFKATGSK
ncbi:MAG: hypothetical protein ABIO46_11250 [Chitinophagales bacterium]